MNVQALIAEFKDDFPLAADVATSTQLFLPVRTTLEHVLVRLAGGGLLCWRVATMAALVADKQRARMKLGHFWDVALAHTAAVARIWTVIKSALATMDGLYVKLRPALYALPESKCQYLPPNESLSESILAQWPSSPLKMEVEKVKVEFPTTTSTESIHQSSESKFCMQKINGGLFAAIIERTTETKRQQSATTNGHSGPPKKAKLERNYFKQLDKKSMRTLRAALDAFSQWRTLEDVTAFAASESIARKANRKASITRGLDQRQWRAMRSFLRTATTDGAYMVESIADKAVAWLAIPALEGALPANWPAIKAKFRGCE